MLLRDKVLHLLRGLSVLHGAAYAREQAKRDMIGTTWRRPGARSEGRVERQLAREGLVKRERLAAGDRMPNGERCERPIIVTRVVPRYERRQMERKARKERERKPSPPPGMSHSRPMGLPRPTSSEPPATADELRELSRLAFEAIGPPTRPL